jgi:hypothetical protein
MMMTNYSSNSQMCPNNKNCNQNSISTGNPSDLQNSVQNTVISGYTGSERSLSSLSGLSRSIILAIYQSCKLTGSTTTNKVTIDYLASTIGRDRNCIRTSIYRLKLKRLLRVVTYKSGRGGWVIYELPQDLYLNISRTEKLNSTNFGPRVNLVPDSNYIN